MGIYAVKPWFRGRLTGAADALVRKRVAADTVTLAGLAASAGGGLAIIVGNSAKVAWLLVPLFALARITANALDGLVAQRSGTARAAGELLNETSDRLADALLILPIAVVDGVAMALPFAAFATAELASFVGITSRAAGGARRYDGPMGKPDRMALVGLASVFAVFAGTPDTIWEAALVLVIVGAVVTAANRFVRAWRELDASPGQSS